MMDTITTLVIALTAMYVAGFGALYHHFTTIFMKQLDFNDIFLRKLDKLGTRNSDPTDETELEGREFADTPIEILLGADVEFFSEEE